MKARMLAGRPRVIGNFHQYYYFHDSLIHVSQPLSITVHPLNKQQIEQGVRF